MAASAGLSESYKVETYSINAKLDIEFWDKHVLCKARSKGIKLGIWWHHHWESVVFSNIQ